MQVIQNRERNQLYSNLTLSTLSKIFCTYKNICLILPDNRIDISCKLSPLDNLHEMSNHVFLEKNRRIQSICHLLIQPRGSRSTHHFYSFNIEIKTETQCLTITLTHLCKMYITTTSVHYMPFHQNIKRYSCNVNSVTSDLGLHGLPVTL